MNIANVIGITGSRRLVGDLIPICRGFEAKAAVAKENGCMLFIPAGESLDERSLMSLVRGEFSVSSEGNDGTEPVYFSLEEGNVGCNLAGSAHPGYLVINPNTLEIIDMIDRCGATRLSSGGQYQAIKPDEQSATRRQPVSLLPRAKVASGSGSLSACPYSILVALDAFEKNLGNGRAWTPVNQQQDALINWRETCGADISRLGDVVKGLCSSSADELNKFLSDNGFSIKLDPLGPDDLGAVGILDLLVEWLNAGSEQSIRGQDGKTYAGVRIKNAAVLDIRGTHYAARLETKDGTCAYIMPDDRPADQFQLMGRVNDANAFASAMKHSRKYKGVDFPMVNMRVREDMSWLLGMNTVGEDHSPWRITQALQENRLRMNQFGARAQSATAVAVTRGISFEQPFVVDRPFIVWFTRPGCTRPLFAAWVDYSDWSNPGDLKAQ